MNNTHGLNCRPAPRWIVLPGDPDPLRRWLHRKQIEETGRTYDEPPMPDEHTEDAA